MTKEELSLKIIFFIMFLIRNQSKFHNNTFLLVYNQICADIYAGTCHFIYFFVTEDLSLLLDLDGRNSQKYLHQTWAYF